MADEPVKSKQKQALSACHVVAMPYPGRGHINPMINLCRLLASTESGILITFVVTEEWLGILGAEHKPDSDNIRFGTIPNVVPSELCRASDIEGFIEATLTKMEVPFDGLLDRLEPPATVIVADTHLSWAVGVGNRRNIPVASFWTMSASWFSVFHHFDLLVQNGHFPIDLSEKGDELVDYIPGVTSTRIADLPSLIIDVNRLNLLHRKLKVLSWVPKAQYLLFSSFYELEAHAIDALKPKFSFPIYSFGPVIPYFNLGENSHMTTDYNDHMYLPWLDNQPNGSVLYISMGSYLSVSSTQMDEIVAGLRNSGVRYLWVAREQTCLLKEVCGDLGLIVPWCDQLRVLSHSSIGGFWSHCGWNSILEGVYAGVPFLTFPISLDQGPNSKLIVDDWKVGWRVRKDVGGKNLVTGEEIASIVQNFMDLGSDEGKSIRRRARNLKEMCRQAIAKDGSSETNIKAFIRGISRWCSH